MNGAKQRAQGAAEGDTSEEGDDAIGGASSSSRGVLLGFARVLSGVLRAGQKLHLCTTASSAAETAGGERVEALEPVAESCVAVHPYVMMGGEYHGVPTASAGMIVALEGELILFTVSFCASPANDLI